MKMVVTLLLCMSFAAGATIRVPDDVATIQGGIDVAADGDIVLVGSGEYVVTEPVTFNRLHEPGDGSPPVRDIVLRAAAGPDETTIRMAETPDDPERASVVVFRSGETNATVLEGFTLTGGRGTGAGQGGLVSPDDFGVIVLAN